MTEPAFKRWERRVAAFWGARRNPNTGEAISDIHVGTFMDIECKYTAGKLPAYLKSYLKQARANARRGVLPIVVLGERGMRPENAIVLVQAGDLREWIGDGCEGAVLD